MSLISWGLVLSAVLLGSLAQLLLKVGTTAIGHFTFTSDNLLPIGWKLATQPYIMGGMLFYALSLVLWLMALSRLEVSVAYPLVSLGYVLTALAAWFFLGESLSTLRLLGIGVIMLGALLVAKSA